MINVLHDNKQYCAVNLCTNTIKYIEYSLKYYNTYSPTGDAPATSEWSTVLLPAKVSIILEVWRY